MATGVRNGPRDLLRWLDYALQASQDRSISASDVEQARIGMSRNALLELAGAYFETNERIEAVLQVVFGQEPEREYTRTDFREHVQDLLVNNPEMRALATMRWLQRQSSRTLPELFFEMGVISIRSDQKIILPYEEDYTPRAFDRAKSIFLTPALAPAIRSH